MYEPCAADPVARAQVAWRTRSRRNRGAGALRRVVRTAGAGLADLVASSKRVIELIVTSRAIGPTLEPVFDRTPVRSSTPPHRQTRDTFEQVFELVPLPGYRRTHRMHPIQYDIRRRQ